MKDGVRRRVLFLVALGVAGVVLTTALVVYSGGGYAALTARSPDGHAVYELNIRETKDGFVSVISPLSKSGRQPLQLKGKAACLALDPAGERLAVALLSTAGPNQYGNYYLSLRHEIVFVDTSTMRISHRWPVNPSGLPAPDEHEYVPPIVRLDRMAFSSDATVIATYYWKPAPQGRRSVVTLWEVATGQAIRELYPPPTPSSLAGAIHTEAALSMRFSSDDRMLAFACTWPVKDPKATQPSAVIQVWSTADGSVVAQFRTPGSSWPLGLCFGPEGTTLAGWSPVADGKVRVEVFIWRLPTGALISRQKLTQRVLGLAWDPGSDAFVVHLEGGQKVNLANEAEK